MRYIERMKFRFTIPMLLIGLSSPALAQEAEEDGLSLMERGAQLLMEGMLKEMQPALEGLEQFGPMLREFAQEMGPAFAELMGEIKDWSAYHPPEILPNGDIIMRLKTPEEQLQDGDQIDI